MQGKSILWMSWFPGTIRTGQGINSRTGKCRISLFRAYLLEKRLAELTWSFCRRTEFVWRSRCLAVHSIVESSDPCRAWASTSRLRADVQNGVLTSNGWSIEYEYSACLVKNKRVHFYLLWNWAFISYIPQSQTFIFSLARSYLCLASGLLPALRKYLREENRS